MTTYAKKFEDLRTSYCFKICASFLKISPKFSGKTSKRRCKYAK
jgi:hypothetical protein